MTAPFKPDPAQAAIHIGYFPSRSERAFMADPCPQLPLARHSMNTATQPASDTAGEGKPASPSRIPPILPGTGQGKSIEAVLMARLQQVVRGYTPEADGEKTVFDFVQLLRLLTSDVERAWPFPKSQRDRRALRKYLAELGATTLAAIDRLDKEELDA